MLKRRPTKITVQSGQITLTENKLKAKTPALANIISPSYESHHSLTPHTANINSLHSKASSASHSPPPIMPTQKLGGPMSQKQSITQYFSLEGKEHKTVSFHLPESDPLPTRASSTPMPLSLQNEPPILIINKPEALSKHPAAYFYSPTLQSQTTQTQAPKLVAVKEPGCRCIIL